MKIKLLIVDDEPIVMMAMEAYLLSEDDVELITCMSGAEGLQAWQTHKPDLTFLDLRMPEMDGVEVLRQMQAAGGLEQHPIIVLSGHVTQTERESCTALGAQDVWNKPMDPGQFMNFLDDLRQKIAARHAAE